MTDLAWISGLELSDTERGTIALMLSPDTDLEVVSDGMSGDQLWDAIVCSVKVYSLHKRSQALLKPVIGKLLLLLEDHPEAYKSRGHKTYDDFLSSGCRELFGLPRSEAYRSKRLVKTWPNLSPAEFSEIGENKLYALSSFTNGDNQNSERWLEIAKSSTLDQLKDRMVQANVIPGTSVVTPAVISFTTTVEVKSMWNQLVSNPRVHSYVGSDSHGSILKALIEEASGSWPIYDTQTS